MRKAPSLASTPTSSLRRSQRGQIIIEYILLMVITLGFALMILRAVVNRDPENPGFLVQRWQGMLVQIGKDDPNRRGP